MVMFRLGQEIKIHDDASLSGVRGCVRMIESDGSAWIELKNKNAITTEVKSEYKVRGQCVLIFPGYCEPI